MNKLELVEKVTKNVDVSKKDMTVYVDCILNDIKDALAEGEKISIQGFGVFDVAQRAEREGINPKTKERIIIPAYKSVRFKPSKVLKEAVNR